MPLTDQTAQIVKLAWARMLHLGDTALDTGDPGVRVEVVDDDAAAATFVRLFDRTVIFGPSEVVGDARRIKASHLAEETTLLELVRAHHAGARALGAAHLLYCEDPPQLPSRYDVAVSFEPEHVTRLMSTCPADDVATSGLADAQWAAALVADVPDEGEVAGPDVHVPGPTGSGDDDADTVLAAAGREVWEHVIAQLGLLTHPEHRSHGHGRFIAAVAMEEALADGLVPQWRAAVENPASRRVALQLGFIPAGTQTTVLLD